MMLKKWLVQSLENFKHFEKAPKVQHSTFSVWTLLVRAWGLSHGHRLRFLTVNFVVVLLGLVPVLAPIFAVNYPTMMMVPFLPEVSIPIAALLTKIMPWVYFIFAYIPFKLALFLIAARIVYQQPYRCSQLLFRYCGFFWWTTLLMVVVLSSFFIGIPLVFVATKVTLWVVQTHPAAVNGALLFFGFLVFLVSIYLLVAASLIFIGRVNFIDASKTAITAVNRYFWKILAVVLLEIGFELLSHLSLHLSDFICVPLSYLLWLVLYQHLFGDKACPVE